MLRYDENHLQRPDLIHCPDLATLQLPDRLINLSPNVPHLLATLERYPIVC